MSFSFSVHGVAKARIGPLLHWPETIQRAVPFWTREIVLCVDGRDNEITLFAYTPDVLRDFGPPPETAA